MRIKRSIINLVTASTTASIPQPNRWLYWFGGLFFAALSAFLSLLNTFSPLFGFSWLVSILLISLALGVRFVPPPSNILGTLSKSLTVHALEILAVLIFTGVAAGFQIRTLAPTIPLPETSRLDLSTSQKSAIFPLAIEGDGISPVYNDGSLGIGFYTLEKLFTAHDLGGLQRLSGFFSVLIIPAVYLLGRVLDGSLTGIFAAGLASVSGWTLALGKSGEVFPALAFFGAIYLAVLIHAHRNQSRAGYIATGLLFVLGWLFSPLFIYMVLLPLLLTLLGWLQNRKLSILSFRNLVAVLIISVALLLPFALAPHIAAPVNPSPYQIGLSAAARYTDSFSSSLLIFVVTHDPNPLHGLVNRPVFPPIIAVAFIIGLYGWILTSHCRKHYETWFILIALLAALLPATLLIEPPLRYPDLQRAGLALPIAILIAGFSFSLIACPLVNKIGRVWLFAVGALFLFVLLIVGNDAYQHYTTIFLPAYQQAAPVYIQLVTHTPSS